MVFIGCLFLARISKMLKFYDKLVNKSPILTQSIMAAGTCFLGDIVAQKITPWIIDGCSSCTSIAELGV